MMPEVFGFLEKPRGPGEEKFLLRKSGHLSAKLSQVPPNVHLAELNLHLDLKQDRCAANDLPLPEKPRW